MAQLQIRFYIEGEWWGGDVIIFMPMKYANFKLSRSIMLNRSWSTGIPETYFSYACNEKNAGMSFIPVFL